MRERLPNTRQSVTTKLVLHHKRGDSKVVRIHIYITAGLYPDGRAAELFFVVNGGDDSLRGWCNQWAIAISLCLQSGVTLEKLAEKFLHQNFPPNGFTESADIRNCSSIVDFTLKWMLATFTPKEPIPAKPASPDATGATISG